MAISSTSSRNDYTGTSALHVYAYSFRILLNTHLRVVVRGPDSIETVLTLTTDYTVSGVLSANGGNVTLVNASQAWLTSGELTTGWILTLRRVLPLTQTTDIRNQGDFYPESHENEFDRRVMVAQQQQDLIDRSITLPETISGADFDTALPATITSNPGTAIIVNAAGDGLELGIATAAPIARIFNRDTYATLKATAAAAPTTLRFGWATDLLALVFYTGDTADGDSGWVVIAGAGSLPPDGGLI